MIIFFETYSIIQALFLYRYIKKADKIYFHKRSFPPLIINPKKKRFVEMLIRLFNRDSKVETLPCEKINIHNWAMNKKAIETVDNLSLDIESSSIYKATLGIIRDENILKCYQAQLIDNVSSRLLFFKMAELLIAAGEENIILIPRSNDNTRIIKELSNTGERFAFYIPGACIFANQAISFFRKIYLLVILFFLPEAYIILKSRRITFSRIKKQKYDIAMSVIWGFHRGDVLIDGIKRGMDDGYLYNDKVKRGAVIHIFRWWRQSAEIENNFRRIMQEQGIPFADKRKFKLDFAFFKKAASIKLQIIKPFFRYGFFRRDNPDYIFCGIKVIYWMLQKYLEFENVDFKVEFIRSDYSADHIVETILCNQDGRKTVGIQHVATPYDACMLCYIHFNKYIVYADIFIRAFSPHWSSLNLVRSGGETVDLAINLINDKGALLKIREKVSSLYGTRKYTIVIAMSSDVDYNLKSRWDEMYRALLQLKDHADIDCHLFLRFRSEDYIYASDNMRRFAELPRWDERIIIDNKNFSTYELMALANVFIGCNISFSINEALATKAKVFTFNLHDRAKYFFGDTYGKDFILDTAEDILRVFNGLKDGFKDFDCNWELLKKDCNFYYDGKNLERIQEAVYDTLCQVKDN